MTTFPLYYRRLCFRVFKVFIFYWTLRANLLILLIYPLKSNTCPCWMEFVSLVPSLLLGNVPEGNMLYSLPALWLPLLTTNPQWADSVTVKLFLYHLFLPASSIKAVLKLRTDKVLKAIPDLKVLRGRPVWFWLQWHPQPECFCLLAQNEWAVNLL